MFLPIYHTGIIMDNWIRSELKGRAKTVLKTSYWKAFLVALLITCTGGGGGAFKFDFPSSSDHNNQFSPVGDLFNLPHFFWALFGVFAFFIIILALAFGIFLTGPLEVNGKKYYIRAALGEINLGYIGFCFEKGRYIPVVKTMFFKNLYNFLWTLLFIIPGIIKSYSYRMVPYILTDNPTLDTKRVIDLSRNIMDGNKFNAFLLDLSFIGWYILGLIALGVGVLFVNPYAFSTNAELYLTLREYALKNNLCSYEELNLQRQQPTQEDAKPETPQLGDPDQPLCDVTVRIK